MIPIIRYPKKGTWDNLLQRPAGNSAIIKSQVEAIIEAVKAGGDKAIRKYTKQFDGHSSLGLKVTRKEIETAKKLSPTLRKAIDLAAANIRKFHATQCISGEHVTTMAGVDCWRKSVPIDKVGLYIPGGTAPLFSTLLMLGIPAILAGCTDIMVCTPADKKGLVHPAILYVARLLGITHIYKIGGVQAIAALAYGTATVPKVDKIFGPGNSYVAAAKLLVQQEGVAIDMPAGPSEVCVLADDTANPAAIAADLLAQAEHGTDSQVILITSAEEHIKEVNLAVKKQVAALDRKNMVMATLANSRIVLVKNMRDGMAIANAYAPEHLIINCRNEERLAAAVRNAGSVFLGAFSPEAAGDYATGTNHTLPTDGFAKAYSGVSVDSFVKKITFQRLSYAGLSAIGPAVITMAEAEGLDAHANAIRIRLKQ